MTHKQGAPRSVPRNLIVICLDSFRKDHISLYRLSDHGHPLADHGRFLKGAGRLYPELLKVPFIFYAPKLEPGRWNPLVSLPDVLPTVQEILGLGSEAGLLAGQSFLSVLTGDSDYPRNAVICGYHEAEDRRIRDDRWTVIVRPDDRPDELYDRQNDPRERHNLIEELPDVARQLMGAYGTIWFRRPVTAIKGLQGRYEVT